MIGSLVLIGMHQYNVQVLGQCDTYVFMTDTCKHRVMPYPEHSGALSTLSQCVM